MDVQDLYRIAMMFYIKYSTSKSQRRYSYKYPKNLISRFFLTERHRYVRSILHRSKNLDIGCGLYKITSDSVGLDMKAWKRPDIVGSVMTLPFEDGSFDSITLLELIEHFHPQGQQRIMQELNRVIRLHGQLIVSMPNMSPYWSIPYKIIWWLWERAVMNEYIHEHVGMISRRQLGALLFQNGFLIVRIHRVALLDVIIEAWKVNTIATA